ncbi:MAG: signal peptide peptidase SppA [Gammaproteobacteria bacterium]|nr:signal peptide peptidase SppA [Gammaproteobacteria bacterium]
MASQDQAHPGFFRSVGRFLSAARTVTANILFVVVIVVLLFLFFSGEERVVVPDGAALVLKLDAPILEEAPRPDPFELLFTDRDTPRPIEMRDLMHALEHAAADDRIGALVLDLDRFPGAAPATLHSLGKAIKEFRASGKPVIVVADNLSQPQYILASYADQLYLNPMGQVLLSGLALQPTFFASGLDKLKVSVNVFRAGEYKSAVEPFLRDDMSDEARANAQQLIDEIWHSLRDQVASNRGMAPEMLDTLIEEQPQRLRGTRGDLARLALETGLVDELLARDAGRDRLIQMVGRDERGETYRKITHRNYLRDPKLALTSSRKDDRRIGVIVAEGTIIGGEQPRGTAVGEPTLRMIRQARRDDGVRAIVLRVNSPGGSAFTSELIRRELELAQVAGKPVVVSMGSVAASGGYWVSATADRIFAEQDTITGSIGVYGLLPTFEQSFAALGVYSDGVGTHSLSGAGNPMQPLNPALAEILEQRVAQANQQFMELVARGRDMDLASVEALAAGRVWSGLAAHELGLVDELGGLDRAVAEAAELAGLEQWSIDYFEEPPSTRDLILERMLTSQAGRLLGGTSPVASWQSLTRLNRVLGEPLLSLDRLLEADQLQALCTACTIR